MSDGSYAVEYSDGKGYPLPTVSTQPKWAIRLWPAISWLVFAINLAGVISTIVDLFNFDYDNIKYATVIFCACASYAALRYINENIKRFEL